MRPGSEALVRHWELKLASLLIAFAVWIVVVSTEQSQLGLAAPVDYVGLGRDTILVPPRRATVDVEVQAPRGAAARLGPENVRVRVNLEGLPAGESLLAIGPEQVQVPRGVRVVRITPARLRVALARATVTRMAVAARVQGQPASGYGVGRVTVDPETVAVRGPQSTIEGRTVVETEAIDVSGSQADVIRTVGLVLPDSLSAVKDRAVQVKVEIRKRGSAK